MLFVERIIVAFSHVSLETEYNAVRVINYNIPKACLLNRSPVPAMDQKSNRSGL